MSPGKLLIGAVLAACVLQIAAQQGPGPVYNVAASNVTATSLVVTWYPPDTGTGVPNAYMVLVCDDPQCITLVTSTQVGQLSAKSALFMGLTTGTYYCMVQSLQGNAVTNGTMIIVVLQSPGGASCASPITVPTLGNTDPIYVGGLSPANPPNKYPIVCGAPMGSWGAGLVWYQFTPTISGAVTVDNCGDFNLDNPMSLVISIYTINTPGNCNTLQCVASQDQNACGTSNQVTWNANAGTNYYLAVGGNGTANGEFTLSVNYGSIPGAVTGLVATEVTTGSFLLSWNNMTSTAPHVWFSIFQGFHHQHVANVQTPYYNYNFGLTMNTTYFIFVEAYTIYATGPPSAPIVVTTLGAGNPGCPMALQVPVGGVVVNQTLLGVPPQTLGAQSCAIGGHGNTLDGPILWYTFTSSLSVFQVMQIDTCGPQTNGDTVINVYAGSCNSTMYSLICQSQNDNGCSSGKGSATYFPAWPNTVYYIAVSAMGPVGGHNGGDFQLAISNAILPGPPFNLILVYVGPDVITVEWELPLTAANEYITYMLMYSCPDGSCAPGSINTNGPHGQFGSNLYPVGELTGLNASTVYEVQVMAVTFGPGPASNTISVQTLGIGAGQSCSNTIPLADQSYYIGTTQGAYIPAGSLGSTCGQTVRGRPTAWFTFVGTGNEVSISSCMPSSNFGAEVFVFSGPQCGPFACVAFSYDRNHGCGIATFNSTYLTTYTILVLGFNYDFGTFELSIDAPMYAVAGSCGAAPQVLTTPLITLESFNVSGVETQLPACTQSMGAQLLQWYSVVIPNTWTNGVSIGTCSGGTNFDAQVSVFTGTCGSLSCVAGQVIRCTGSPNGGVFAINSATAVAGTTLYIAVFNGPGTPANATLNTFSLAFDQAQPSAPLTLTAAAPSLATLGQTFLGLQWTAGAGNSPDTTFVLVIDLPNAVPIFVSQSNNWVVENLQPYTNYTFTIYANNLASVSAAGPSVTLMTLPYPPSVCTSFSPSAFTNPTATTVALVWTGPANTGGPAVNQLSYTVCSYDLSSTVVPPLCLKNVGTYAQGSFTYTFSQLQPGSSYNFSVQAVNAGGASPQVYTDAQTANSGPSGTSGTSHNTKGPTSVTTNTSPSGTSNSHPTGNSNSNSAPSHTSNPTMYSGSHSTQHSSFHPTTLTTTNPASGTSGTSTGATGASTGATGATATNGQITTATSSSGSSTTGPTGMSGGAKAGIAIVIILIIVGLGIGLFVWRRRQATYSRLAIQSDAHGAGDSEFGNSGFEGVNRGRVMQSGYGTL